MSNHSSDFPESDGSLAEFIRAGVLKDRLGATGKFPAGKLDKTDEGGIRFAIATNPTTRKVIINFGTPVVWMGMDKEQAIALGESLITRAKELPDG